jgi:hypothetical protein
VEKRHDSGTGVEAVWGRAPRLLRAARHVKPFDRLTLGEALGCEIAILRKEVSPFEAIPALVAIIVASLRPLDDRPTATSFGDPSLLSS